MKRKIRRGGLIRKQGLTQKGQEYRVLSVNITTEEIIFWGTYTDLQEALNEASKIKKDGLEVYVHGDSNRVISKV